MIYSGIDPGYSGAIAVLKTSRRTGSVIQVTTQRLNGTEQDIVSFLSSEVCSFSQNLSHCYLERVSAMPKQGVASTFKFGMSYGFCRGVLIAKGISFETITPHQWQQKMKCKSGGDKNITKSAAQQLFPNIKVTHAIADALLIAEYLRRIKTGELK